MTEIAARLPRPRGLVPLLAALAAVGSVAVAVAVVLRAHDTHAPVQARTAPAPLPAEPSAPAEPAPPSIPPEQLPTADLDAASARAFGRSFFYSRRGVLADARAVASWRRPATRAARGSGVPAGLLLAMVYVESRGHAGAIAGSRVGLTQLTPTEAREAGLHVNARRSRRLTRAICWYTRHWNDSRARQLARLRARVDRRFAPLAELRGTVRWLRHARRELGRLDLAVAAHHLGVSGLRGTVERFGGGTPSYAQLYHGSAPDHRPAVYRRLNAHGMASYDYLWNVLAAKRVIGLASARPAKLVWEDGQQHRKNSAEEVLHPRAVAREFRNPRQLARAWRRGVIRAIPLDTGTTHLRVGPLGDMAHALGVKRKLYRSLRPGALGVLLEIGRRVHALSGVHAPLHVTSAVRDDRYQAALMRVNPSAARTYSHTTGYSFDIARSFASPRQERALVWVHVDVASRTANELSLIHSSL